MAHSWCRRSHRKSRAAGAGPDPSGRFHGGERGGGGGGEREKDSERWKQCSLREVEREGGDRKRDVDRGAGGGGGGWLKRDAE